MKEKFLNFATLSLGILSGGILIFVAVKYVLPVLSPFIIAWLVATVTRKPAKRLSESLKIPERVLRLMMSLFITFIAILAIGTALWQVTSAVWRFLSDIGEGNRLYELLMSLLSPERPILGDILPEELALKIGETLGSFLTTLLSSLASGVTAIAGAIPQVFLFIVVTLISLVYFALDYDRIGGFISSLLPKKASGAFSRVADGTLSVLGKYLRSYSLILIITYVTVFIGFMLLRVEHALVIAIFVALLDILPVIGVGTVLVPWSIFELASGNRFLGIGLLVLFVVNAVIRQLAEPKIVGKNLNLHPIITLIMLYVGYALFGFAGLLLLPILSVVIGVLLNDDNSTAQVG